MSNLNTRKFTNLRVAVVEGGWNGEREVSLTTSQQCQQALQQLGCQVQSFMVDQNLINWLAELQAYQPAVIFNALHGSFGEDGTVQGIFDSFGWSYTHSSRLASSLAMDKVLCKQYLAGSGVQAPPHILLQPAQLSQRSSNHHEVLAKIIEENGKAIIKPRDGGSTVDVQLIASRQQFDVLLGQLTPRSDYWMLEQYIPGREFTVGMIGPNPTPITEIIIKADLYDYHTKYHTGLSYHQCPAQISPELAQLLQHWTKKVHNLMGCTSISRADFRWDEAKYLRLLPKFGTEAALTDSLYFIEINTQPGLTPNSLLPEQASKLGMSFADLITTLLQDALATSSFDNLIRPSRIQDAE